MAAIPLPEDVPADVAATVGWLEEEGWEVVEDRVGEGSGNRLHRFRNRRGDVVVVSRDRGQWVLAVALAGWSEIWDIDLALAGVTGEEPARWDPGVRWEGPLAEQLPVGVEWRVALPVVLDRLCDDHGAEDRILALVRQRSARPDPDLPAVDQPGRRRSRLPWPRRAPGGDRPGPRERRGRTRPDPGATRARG